MLAPTTTEPTPETTYNSDPRESIRLAPGMSPASFVWAVTARRAMEMAAANLVHATDYSRHWSDKFRDTERQDGLAWVAYAQAMIALERQS